MLRISENKRLLKVSISLCLGFVFLLANSSPAKAVDGLFNGKFLTGETDDFVLWLQSYDQNTSPYYNDLFFLNKVGNVGIGTTAPGAKLDIVGALRTTSATISLLGNSGNRIVMTDDSGNLYATSSSIASGLPAPIAGNKNFTLRSDGTNWIANSLIYNDGTNVGIGTTDPGARLDIYSNTNSQLKLAGYEGISGSNVASGQINIGSLGYLRYVGSTGKLYIDNALDSNGGDIRFRTRTLGTPIDAMTISGSGNVGIGTTVPGKRLEVFDSDNVQLLVSGWNTVGTNEASGSIQIGDHSTIHGKVQFNGATGAIYIDNFFDNVGGDIHFRNRVSGTPVNSMTIGGDGNVGIGTTAPSVRLDLGGGTAGRITGLDTAPAAVRGDSEAVPKKWIVDNFAPAIGGASLWATSSAGTYNVGLGNVGVGISNPGERLEVKGNIRISSDSVIKSSSSGISSIQIYNSANGNMVFQSGFQNAGILFQTSSTGNNSYNSNVIINGAGNIGIGTTAPSVRLDLGGGIAGRITGLDTAPAAVRGDSEAVPKKWIVDNFAPSSIVGSASLWATSTSGIYNVGLGNVGIGTTNPGAKLDIAGNAIINSYNVFRSISLNPGSPQIILLAKEGQATVRINGSFVGHRSEGSSTQNIVEIRAQLSSNNAGLFDFAIQAKGRQTQVNIKPVTVTYNSEKWYGIRLFGTTNAFYPDLMTFTGFDNTNGFSVVSESLVSNIVDWMPSSAMYTESFYNKEIFNGNVGIGTPSPSVRLDLGGGTLGRITGLDTAPAAVRGDSEAVPKKWIVDNFSPIAGPGAALTGSGTANYIPLWTGTGSLGVSNIYNTATNVGIGTNNPGAKLEIFYVNNETDPDTSNYPLKLKNNGWNSNMVNGIEFWNGQQKVVPTSRIVSRMNGSGNGGENLYLQTQSPSAINPNPNQPTTKLTIAADGGVGIGTNNPTQILELYKSAAGEIGPVLNLVNPTSSANSAVELRFGPSSSYARYASIRGINIDGQNNIELAFLTGAGGSITEKMRINSAGFVGIGVTNPGYKLDVAGEGNFVGQIHGVSLPTQGTDAANRNYVDGLAFWSGTLAGNISNLNSGNAGIGTTNPLGKLGISQNMSNYNTAFTSPHLALTALSNTNDTGFVGITYGASSSPNYGWSSGALRSNSGQSDFVWKYHNSSAAGVEMMRLSGAGVLSAVSFSGPISGTVSAANVSMGQFGSNIGEGGIWNFSTGAKLGVAYTAAQVQAGTATFAVNGNMGIGTINPSNSQLHVAAGLADSTIRIGSIGYVGVAEDNTTFGLERSRNQILFSTYRDMQTDKIGAKIVSINKQTYSSASNRSAIQSTDLAFFTTPPQTNGYDNTLERMRITDNGNVGIGTTDPGLFKLKVVGNAAITGTLQTMTGSDFAEEFTVSYPIEAGTVVVMGDLGYKSVKACSQKYDTTVVGIVSDDPSIIAGKVDSKHKAVVAMMGVVKVKVTDVNGKIKKGTLLTTSSIPGYAMKSSDYTPGTMIGKALEDLSGSRGEIKVLVNLQ